MRINCIAWTRYDRRADLLAQHLGVRAHFVYRGQRGKYIQAPLRYVAQTADTWRLLTSERPEIIFVQCPPVFAPLLVALYARRNGARYVVDAHTGAFLSPKWRWSLPLLRTVTRGAVTTLVTNEYLKSLVEGWGAHASILAFTPGQYPQGEPFPFGDNSGFHVVVVSMFEIDEPLEVVFNAARRLPDVRFYITGNPKNAAAHLLAKKPHNCHLTGYLPYAQYIGLLRGSDAVMDLTTRNHTLLMGAFEAVSLGTPLIVSDWPILKTYFSKGTVWVPNTVEGICEGVRRAQQEQASLRQNIQVLRKELQAQWNHDFNRLKQIVAIPAAGGLSERTMPVG